MTMYVNGYKLGERAELAARGLPYREHKPMDVSTQAVLNSMVPARPRDPLFAMDAAARLKPYAFLEVVVPAELAQDYAPNFGGISSWAAQGLFHEGQGFFGYQLLAELMQRAEYRHAAEIWAEHAVRKWVKLTGSNPDKIAQIEAEMVRLNVRDTFQTWMFHDHCYGRGQMFLDFGDADRPDELLTPLILTNAKVSPRRPLQSLNIVEPMWSAPGSYNTNNPLTADFYKPRQWLVYGKRVDKSRMLTITSRPVSDMLKPAYAFGGQSLVQLMKPYVDNWLRTRQAGSDMVNSYSILVFKTDMSSMMQGGNGQSVYDRLDIFNQLRDNRGSFAIDKEMEELENIAVSLAGLKDMVSQAQEQLASAARIPLSIYLQITPTGLNATNDGETRNFYADVHSYQQKNVRTPFLTVLQAVQLSLFGEIDPDIGFQFEPLWEMSDADKALIRKSDADAHNAYVSMGAVSNEEVREVLEEDEDGLYAGVDLSGPAPEPEPDETTTTGSDNSTKETK